MAKYEKQIKFVVEYKDDEKKLSSRWTYDLNKNPYGPILVEEFNLPRPEKRKRKKKNQTNQSKL